MSDPASKRKRIGWVLGGLMVLVIAGGALAAHSRFEDVTDDHPVDAIEWAADLEITLGCDTDKFCPDQPLKRKHARVFIERFYDQVLGADGDDQFTNPDFTRADMMALLHSMTTPTATTTTTTPSTGALAAHSRFEDVTDDHPVDAIEWAADLEITLGCDTDKFCPDQPLKRKHARVFIERFYDQVLGADGDDQFTNPDFTRADMMALLHSMTAPAATTTTTTPSTTTTSASTGSLDVWIAPEDCAGYSRTTYQPHGTSWRALGAVGYLTGRTLTSGDVDHVVALEEAWCSGIRSPQFGSASQNHRASVSSVNSGKGGRDPLEWWNTSGSTSPARVSYPGWCDYLALHVQVKQSWNGTMDQQEHDFIVGQLADCTNNPTTTTTAPTTTTVPPGSGSCTHWHAGHPKHTHPGTGHDGTHTSGKCAGY